MNQYPSISLVIPSFNGLKHLQDFLDKIMEVIARYKGKAELVIVDDKSVDASVQYLTEKAKQYEALSFYVNDRKGACSARNFGVRKSKYEFIFFVDNDVLLEDDYLNKAAHYLKPETFMVAASGYNYFSKQQQDGVKLIHWKRGFMRFTGNIMNDRLNTAETYLSYGVQGAYFFCKRDKFDALGGFDQDLFEPYLFDETDLCYRGLKRGWDIVYAPDLNGFHKTGGTNLVGYEKTGTKNPKKVSPFMKYLSKRNRMIFILKNVHDFHLRLSFYFFLLLTIFSTDNFNSILHVLKIRKLLCEKMRQEKALRQVTDSQIIQKSLTQEKKILAYSGN